MCQYKTHSSINKQEDWQARLSAEGSAKFPTGRQNSRGGTVRTKFVRRKAQERFWAWLAMSLDCRMRERRDGRTGQQEQALHSPRDGSFGITRIYYNSFITKTRKWSLRKGKSHEETLNSQVRVNDRIRYMIQENYFSSNVQNRLERKEMTSE